MLLSQPAHPWMVATPMARATPAGVVEPDVIKGNLRSAGTIGWAANCRFTFENKGKWRRDRDSNPGTP